MRSMMWGALCLALACGRTATRQEPGPIGGAAGQAVGSGGTSEGGAQSAGGTNGVGGNRSAGGTQSTGGSSQAGSAGSGAEPGVGGQGATDGQAGEAGAGPDPCTKNSGGEAPIMQGDCASLDRLTISNPQLEDADQDGALEAGEDFALRANLADISGWGHSWYPQVEFESDSSLVTISDTAHLFGVGACQSVNVGAEGTVSPEIEAGSLVTLTLRVGMLNTECSGTPTLHVSVRIE